MSAPKMLCLMALSSLLMANLFAADLSVAFRLQYERSEGGVTITGHGVAFAADLAAYGFKGKKFMLSAAHNVLDDQTKKPFDTLRVEVTPQRLIKCRAVVWDTDFDLCVLKAEDNLPDQLALGGADAAAGARITMLAGPWGEAIRPLTGKVLRRFERGTVRTSMAVKFDPGDSGAPLLDAEGKVVGVAVAGVPKDGDIDPEVGLFVPLVMLKAFLEGVQKRE